MDAKGRAQLGELLAHRSGIAPPSDSAELTSLQVSFKPLDNCDMSGYYGTCPLFIREAHIARKIGFYQIPNFQRVCAETAGTS